MNRRSLLRAALGIAMIPLGRKAAEPKPVMLRGGATAHKPGGWPFDDGPPEYDYFGRMEISYSSTLWNRDIGTHTHDGPWSRPG